jgi:hypothetical protein
VTVRSIRIDARKSSNSETGMSQRRTVSTTARLTGWSDPPDRTPARNCSPQPTSQAAFSASVRVEPRSSTISSAYRANP